MDGINTMTGDPDKPRNWDPNHPSLFDPNAPHETGGALRVHRAGMTGLTLVRTLKMSPAVLAAKLHQHMTEEQQAQRAGRVIYDAPVKKGQQ